MCNAFIKYFYERGAIEFSIADGRRCYYRTN